MSHGTPAAARRWRLTLTENAGLRRFPNAAPCRVTASVHRARQSSLCAPPTVSRAVAAGPQLARDPIAPPSRGPWRDGPGGRLLASRGGPRTRRRAASWRRPSFGRRRGHGRLARSGILHSAFTLAAATSLRAGVPCATGAEIVTQSRIKGRASPSGSAGTGARRTAPACGPPPLAGELGRRMPPSLQTRRTPTGTARATSSGGGASTAPPRSSAFVPGSGVDAAARGRRRSASLRRCRRLVLPKRPAAVKRG